MRLKVFVLSVGAAFVMFAALASNPTVRNGFMAGWNNTPSDSVQLAAIKPRGKHYYDPINVKKRAIRKQLTTEYRAVQKAEKKAGDVDTKAEIKDENHYESAYIKAYLKRIKA